MAVLEVITFHYLPHAGLGPFGLLASFGWTGVDGFLVLSGFLITGILYRQRGAPSYFKNFYLRRALRLFPLYYFVLLLAFVVSLFVGHAWRSGQLCFLLYAANIMMSHDQSLGDLGIFNLRHFWTLALEEQFYFLWPWIVGSRLSREALLRVCAAGIGIAIVCRVLLFIMHVPLWFEYCSLPTRMDSLLIGAAIALMPLPSKAVARWVLGGAALVYSLLVIAGGNSFFTAPPIMLAGYTVLAVLYASLLVLALHPGALVRRLLSLAPLRFLGKLSYGLYLWHYLFSYQAETLIQSIQARIHPQMMGSLAAFLVVLGLSILVAMASYKFIERPFLNMKDRFEPSAKATAATSLCCCRKAIVLKVHLVNMRQSALDAMLELHRLAEPKLHVLVDDPDEAEIILFVGSWDAQGSQVRAHPLPRRYPEKCFVYFDADGFVPLLRGVYTNAEKARLIDSRRTEAQAFIDALNPMTVPQPDTAKKYLFTFAGGSTSLLRKKLYKIDFGREDVIVKNTSDYYHWDPSQAGREQRQKEYASMIAASHFALCPRGASAGGQRLFEVMQMGVAPVLISDALKLPEGPDWSSFLIQVPERRIRQLAEILEPYRSESAERGRLARLAWERCFSPPVLFNQVIAVCARTRETARIPERWVQPFWGFMMWKWRLRGWLRGAAKAVVLRVFRMLGLKFIYQLNRR